MPSTVLTVTYMLSFSYCFIKEILLLFQFYSSARLLCPWNSPGKNTGMGCHSLLQGIFLTQILNPGLQILYRVNHQGRPYKGSIVIIPILQFRKPRIRESFCNVCEVTQSAGKKGQGSPSACSVVCEWFTAF